MFDFELRERADEDLAAAQYDRLYHGFPVLEYWDDDFSRFVARSWSEGDRVLDLGCATGSLWKRWQELPEPSRLVGVDISERMIALARAKYPAGEFHVARAHDLPFAAGSFDVVIASSVLHHIPDSHLDDAFSEIVRVLDEHGRLVGRDPGGNGFAASPGWFSGAVMSFRHLVYRLTRSREYPEPALGEHHHVFDADAFRQVAARHLVLTTFEHRFPFSRFVTRVRDPRVAQLARHLDARLADRGGSMFYYVGEKNYAAPTDVLTAVARAREEVEAVSDAEFLAYLQAATLEIQRLFGANRPVSGDNDSDVNHRA